MLSDDHVHTESESNPFLVTDSSESHSVPRSNSTKTGLRRPDYGPMQSHVFKKQPGTPHVVTRRTVVDESLIEAMIQTHLRPTEAGGISLTGAIEIQTHSYTQKSQQEPEEPSTEPRRSSLWGDSFPPAIDFADFSSLPQTPKRESRTFTTAPGSGRRTPRRRSRSSNQHLRTTPIKALADANEARVNRLISEANKRGRVGRDKHSPMGILRQLSRIPGFNPPPKPSPDREPIPGSANWRKLTPRSTRTRHIDLTGDVANPFKSISGNRTSLRGAGETSRSSDQQGMSSAKRRAIDRFKDDNPFLTEDDYNRLWEEEIDTARNQIMSGRESFGSAFSGEDRKLSLTALADDDTKDLTGPYVGYAELRRGQSVDIGDITGHSSGVAISTHDGSVPLAAGQSDAREGGNRGPVYGVEDASGTIQGHAMGQMGSRVAEEGSAEQYKDLDVDMNDGWEDIPDDELTQDFLSQQGLHMDAQGASASSIVDSSNGAGGAEGQDNSGVDGGLGNTETVDKDNQNLAVIDNEDLEMRYLDRAEHGADLSRLGVQTQGADETLSDALRQDQVVDQQLDEADRVNLDIENQLGGTDELGLGVDEQLDDPDRQDHDDEDLNLDAAAAAARDQDATDAKEAGQDLDGQIDQEFEDGYMNVNDEDHIEQHEHDEQQEKAGIQYYDDFPSELGIMSNGNVLPTSLPKTKKVTRRSRAGIPVPSMPTSLQKQLIHTFSKARMSREAMDVILEGSHLFFEQASNDLAAYASHAGRKTIDEDDVELLMRRLRIIHDKVSMESLLQRYLPRELRDKSLTPSRGGGRNRGHDRGQSRGRYRGQGSSSSTRGYSQSFASQSRNVAPSTSQSDIDSDRTPVLPLLPVGSISTSLGPLLSSGYLPQTDEGEDIRSAQDMETDSGLVPQTLLAFGGNEREQEELESSSGAPPPQPTRPLLNLQGDPIGVEGDSHWAVLENSESNLLGQPFFNINFDNEIILAINMKGKTVGGAYYDGQASKLLVMQDTPDCNVIDMIETIKDQVRPTLILTGSRLEEYVFDALRWDDGSENRLEVRPSGEFSYQLAKTKLVSITMQFKHSEISSASSTGSGYLNASQASPTKNESAQWDAQLELSNLIDLESKESECIENIPKVLQAMSKKATINDWQSILQILNVLQEILVGASPIIERIQRQFVVEDLITMGTYINDVLDFDESMIEGRCVVKRNVDEELDHMRQTYHGLDSFLSEIAKEISVTIPSDFTAIINVIYFPQLGYLITVPRNPEWKSEDDYQLEGLTVQFSTESTVYYKNASMRELDEHLGDIHGLIVDREIDILQALQERIIENSELLVTCSNLCAELDVLVSLARIARLRNYRRPKMTEDITLEIVNGSTLIGGAEQRTRTVPSAPTETTTEVDFFKAKESRYENRVMILTGPNSSGKSVYLKQVALITFMAHVGSFVPADSAIIGITDKILTRLQTRETVSSIESAFMTDLQQVALAIRMATARSLVVLDEFGKGTASTDGAGLFCGVVEHFAAMKEGQPKVLATTHFHELFENDLMDLSLPISLYTMEVYQQPDSMEATFLFRVVPGKTPSSLGPACAAMANMPATIVQRGVYLSELFRRYENVVPQLTPFEKEMHGLYERLTEMLLKMDLEEEHCLDFWDRDREEAAATASNTGDILTEASVKVEGTSSSCLGKRKLRDAAAPGDDGDGKDREGAVEAKDTERVIAMRSQLHKFLELAKEIGIKERTEI
ncbi:MutS protein msh5 [Linnemannia zychae]|nr:MutS protein msh5 [Linnemannia zychae]